MRRSVRRQRSLASSISSGASSAQSDYIPVHLHDPPPNTPRVKSHFYRRPAPASTSAVHPPSTPTRSSRRRYSRLPRCLFRLKALTSQDTITKPKPDLDDDLFHLWTSAPISYRSRNPIHHFLQCLENGSDPMINVFYEECRRYHVTPCPIQYKSGSLISQGYEMTDIHCIAIRHLLQYYPKEIKSLDLTRNSIAYKGAILLANASTNLSSLILTDNKLGRHGAFIWAKFLSQPECRLLSMNLCGNEIGAYGASLLQRGLATNRTLTSLNLSYNQLGNEGAQAISQLVATAEILRVLDIGHNHISTDGAVYLASALERNASLTAFIASWSSFKGSAGILLAVALMTHRRLRRADLRYCDLEPEAGIVLAHALRINNRIEQMLLCGNRLGWSGRALVWSAITSISYSYPSLSMTHCDMKLPVDAPNMRFDPFDPNTLYILDLGNPVQYAIAAEVFALAEQPGVCMISNATLNGDNMQITTGDLDREHPWLLLPHRGLARFQFEWYPAPVHHSAGRYSLSPDQFHIIWRLINDPGHDSDLHRLELLFEICSAFFFDRGQILEILRSFQPGSESRTSAAALFAVRYLPSQDDHQTIEEMLSTGNDPVLSRYESDLVNDMTHGFSALNPSGHYLLDLSNRIHLIICRTLAQISGWQSYRHDPGNVADWSQCGQRHLWRNMLIDGRISSSTDLLPYLQHRLPHGIIEFDFVLRITPDASISPMPAVPFLHLVQTVNTALESIDNGGEYGSVEHHSVQLSHMIALSHIRHACIHNYFLEEQAQVLLGCFPVLDYRVDAFMILYGRIMDELGIRRLASAMFSEMGQHHVMRRMGYTALWSPFSPFSSYSLDLSHHDARILLKSILCLYLVEEHCDIIDISYNGISTCIPSQWLSEAPLHGSLQFRLIFAPNSKPNILYRERLASVVLSWEPDILREASDEMKALYPVIDMVKLRRKRVPSMASHVSSSSGNGSKRAPSLPPVLHARFRQDQDV